VGCVSNLNINGSLQDFSRRIILSEVASALDKKKVAFYEYLVTQEMGLDSSAGVRCTADIVPAAPSAKAGGVRIVEQGDFYVSCGQPAANLIPALLEPQSSYALIRYRSCKLVPETGNFFGLFRVTADARLSTIPYKPWN